MRKQAVGRGGEIRTHDHLHPMRAEKPDSTDVCTDLSNAGSARTPSNGAAFAGAVRQLPRLLHALRPPRAALRYIDSPLASFSSSDNSR